MIFIGGMGNRILEIGILDSGCVKAKIIFFGRRAIELKMSFIAIHFWQYGSGNFPV